MPVHPKRQNLVTKSAPHVVVDTTRGASAKLWLFAEDWLFMRSSTVLACAMAVAACAGTEGDLLRSTPDARAPGDGASPRPPPVPMSTWQIQLSGTLDTTVDVQLYTTDLGTP